MEDAPKEKKISRRDFIKGSTAAVTAAAATAVPGEALAHSMGSATGRRLGMVIDLRKCTGCRACSIACKAEFDVPLGYWRTWVKQVEVGKYPKVQRHFLPRVCNHCNKPGCVTVCPTGASYIRPEDNTVQIDEEKCNGCGLCVGGCPYNSRFLHPHKKVASKCSFCIHRVDQGLVPSCVNTCPAKALIFGDLNDPDSEVSKLVARQPTVTLKPELGLDPRVYYIAPDKTTMRRIQEEE